MHFLCYSPPPLPLSPPLCLSLCSLDMDKFFPVFSLTKRPSVSDTACLGNHRAPVTLSHPTMSRTNIHTQTHKHPLAAHTYTNSRGRFKEHGVCACLCVSTCLFVFSAPASRCTAACYVFVRASSEFAFQPSLHAYVPPAVQISAVGGGEAQCTAFPQELFKKDARFGVTSCRRRSHLLQLWLM